MNVWKREKYLQNMLKNNSCFMIKNIESENSYVYQILKGKNMYKLHICHNLLNKWYYAGCVFLDKNFQKYDFIVQDGFGKADDKSIEVLLFVLNKLHQNKLDMRIQVTPIK